MKNYTLQFGTGDPRTFTGLAPTFLIFKLSDGTNVTPPSIAEVSATGFYTFSWGTTTSIVFLADAATTSPGTAGRYIGGALDPADRADEYGTSLVALGTSILAGQINVGSTLVAIGNTSIAYGGTISANLINTGATLVGIGNTSIAYGGTVSANLINTGATLVAIGNTSIAYGGTVSAVLTNTGVTLVAIGNSLSALGLTGVAIGTSLSALIGTTASIIGDSSTEPSTLFGYVKRISELEQGREQFAKGTGVLTQYDRTGATTLNVRTIANNATLVTKT